MQLISICNSLRCIGKVHCSIIHWAEEACAKGLGSDELLKFSFLPEW